MSFKPAGVVSADFHREVVRPLIGDVPYAAGLLGWGSDVLGYDTERSMDHGWGPRLAVFVDAAEVEAVRGRIDAGLPDEYAGYPVRFGWDKQESVHHVTVGTLGDWLAGHLGFDATKPPSIEDWLVTPQQQLLGVVRGEVYADDGRLQPVREALSWYPDGVWLWLLGCQWTRIGQEEAFVQRTAEVGDELGSRVLAARLVRDLMRLSLLIARQYAPYSKWLGTAFAQLGHPDGLDQDLAAAVAADNYEERERALVGASSKVARRHNALGLTAEVDPAPRQFHERPAMVLGADRFAAACFERVMSPELRRLRPVGGIDQFADNTDVLSNPDVYRRLAGIYRK